MGLFIWFCICNNFMKSFETLISVSSLKITSNENNITNYLNEIREKKLRVNGNPPTFLYTVMHCIDILWALFHCTFFLLWLIFSVSACSPSPCLNDGSCSLDVNFEAACSCNGEWSGYYCSGQFIYNLYVVYFTCLFIVYKV
jgi:hypothetical protein